MSWAAVAVGGATLVSGLMGSSSASKSSKKQLALEREKLKFAQQRYDQAQTMYGGLQQKVVDSAMEGVRPDLQGVSDRAAADIAGQFRGAQQGLMRTNQRLGINPNSGQFQSQMRQTALGEALAKAGGITRAREGERNNAEQQTFARRFQVSQVGVNQMNNTASNVQDASSGLAGVYGQQATGLNAASGAAISNGMGMIAMGLDNYSKNKAAPAPASNPLATGLSSYQPATTYALGEAPGPLVSTPLT